MTIHLTTGLMKLRDAVREREQYPNAVIGATLHPDEAAAVLTEMKRLSICAGESEDTDLMSAAGETLSGADALAWIARPGKRRFVPPTDDQ